MYSITIFKKAIAIFQIIITVSIINPLCLINTTGVHQVSMLSDAFDAIGVNPLGAFGTKKEEKKPPAKPKAVVKPAAIPDDILASQTVYNYYWPVASTSIPKDSITDNNPKTTDFGASRGGGTRTHEGHDIMATYGTPLVAVTGGYIEDTNPSNTGLGGLTVKIRGNDGRLYYYAHLSEINVSKGDKVKAGVMIGRVGNSGNAKDTDAHLHFQVWGKDSNLIKPETWYGIVKNDIGAKAPGKLVPGKVTANLETLKQGTGQNYIFNVVDYKNKLDALGYKGDKSNEYIAALINNGVPPEQVAGTNQGDQTSSIAAAQAKAEAEATQRHNFESNIKQLYSTRLGVEPSKTTLDYHMKKYDQSSGINYNTDDVDLFIKGSSQFQKKITDKSIPTVIELYNKHLGITDITKVPSTWKYVSDKLKSGEWDTSDVESFIMRSPQYTSRTQNQLAANLNDLLRTKYKVAKVGDIVNKYLLPKKNAGWLDSQIEDFVRQTPDFQSRFPGIREDQTPDAYDTRIAKYNAMFWQYKGRAFDINNPEDYKMLTGGAA